MTLITRTRNDEPFHSGAQRDFVRETLAELALPIPSMDEAFETADMGLLFFINPAACTLRISKRDEISIFWGGGDHYDHILQPLGRREGEGLVIDVYPGVRTPVLAASTAPGDEADIKEEANAERLAKLVRGDGYRFTDSHKYNIAYLPGVRLQGWAGFPVILDPGAVGRLRQLTREVQALLPTPVQDKVYGYLRRAFDQAIEGGTAEKREFWQACFRAKKRGKLVADWNTAADIHRADRDIPLLAEIYERRLSKSPAFAKLVVK